MSKFEEHSGKVSLMRKITWIVVLTSLCWGSVEIVAYIIFTKYGIEFDVHESLILTTLGIGITGKVGQKIYENKSPKDEQANN